jgi:homoserine kinase
MIVRVPASSANLGPGFDTLGMALSLYLEASITPGSLAGEPADAGHPTARAFESAGGRGPIWVRSPIPMGRGLGFSGSARVAGVIAACQQRDGRYERSAHDAEVLERSSALEGHADNVAASLFGGVVATADGHTVQLPLGFDPTVVCWVPEATKTSTDESRSKLGSPVAFFDAVFNIGRTALLVAALAAGNTSVLRAATQDRLHQDVRFAAVPRSRVALQHALDAGAWCGWLSGSGPTVATLCSAAMADTVAGALPTELGHAKVLRIDHGGATVLSA